MESVITGATSDIWRKKYNCHFKVFIVTQFCVS